MAVEHQVCVSQVLEGAFVGLHEVGVPLPVCMHLQDNGTRFESAQWTAKQIKSGFFGQFTPLWPKPRKPRRRRRPTQVNRITKSPASVTSNWWTTASESWRDNLQERVLQLWCARSGEYCKRSSTGSLRCTIPSLSNMTVRLSWIRHDTLTATVLTKKKGTWLTELTWWENHKIR